MWLIIATLCAFFVKGLCGFANTLVFTSILGFTTDNINISPVELVLGYPSNIIVAWKERRHIDWKICLPLAALVIGGSLPGILLLKNVDAQLIKIVFGFVVVMIGVEMLLREYSKVTFKESKVVLALIGVVSGLLCGLYGIGALLAAYVGRVTGSSKSFKANICIVFLIENTFRIVAYSVVGIITLSTLKSALLLVPAMLVGLFLGMKSGAVLKEATVKKVVIVALILSGIALVINNL